MDEPRDFFISYTGADVAWAEWIADILEHDGHTTLLQAWDFRPGSDFIQQMHQAVEHTQRTIAVLSERYLASMYAAAEWHAIFAKDPTGQQGLLVPVRVQACEPSGLLTSRVYIDLVGLEEQTAAARLLAGVGRGRARPAGRRPYPGGQPTASGVPFPGRRPAVFNVPPRNAHFTGRGTLLAALRRSLVETSTGAVVQAGAVHGLGGVGKTQLAIEYAHRYAADYDLVWWIPAEEPVAIAGQLASLGRRLGLPELPSLDEQVQVLFDELGKRGRWLLVYDNAEDPAALKGYRPPAGMGQILITSRNPAWGGIAAPVRVDVLGRGEALSFLRQRLGREDPVLGRLADALGDLPLALEQAAAYIEETAITPDGYLAMLVERAPELLALGHPTDTQQTIASTWAVSLRRVHIEAPAAEELLRLCAFLAPYDIPRSLLEGHPDVLLEPLAGAVRDRLAYQQALAALSRYSLATITGDAISVHRLVQAVIRHQLDSGEELEGATTAVRRMAAPAVDAVDANDLAGSASRVAAAIRLLAARFPPNGAEPAVWPVCAQLLPHALAASKHAEQYSVELETAATLLNHAARYLDGRAEYAEAKTLLERSLVILEELLGPQHLEVASTLNALGLALRDLNDPSGARRHLERALAIREAELGSDHPTVLDSLSNLATVLAGLGEVTTARTYLERVLATKEATLGPHHPGVASSHNNLAGVMIAMGDLPAARTQLERAVAITEAAPGLDHPPAAHFLSNLARVLYQLDDLLAARTHLERALAIEEARFGPDHPVVAVDLINLANVVAELGDWPAAQAHLERALAIDEAFLDPSNRIMIPAFGSLGHVLYRFGHVEKARAFFERELALGEGSPGTKQSPVDLTNVGLTSHVLGELFRARTAYEQALSSWQTVLEAGHPILISVQHRLGNVLDDLGDLAEARSLHERALSAREARLGTQHPSLSMSLINLSATLMSQGDAAQAKAALMRALNLLGVHFHSEPSGTSPATKEALQSLHVDSRDLPRAQAALDQALALDEADFLPEHRGVASGLNKLGNLLISLGDLVGARFAFEAALAVRSTHLSPDHPEAADSLDRLGRLLTESGDLKAARTLHERALAIRHARLGPDHELTLRSRENLAAVQALLGNRP